MKRFCYHDPDRRALVLAAALAVAVLALAPPAQAQPHLTSLTPARVSAGTGSTITIFGTGIGYSGDLVRFPNDLYVVPSAYAPGWVSAVVPESYSGAVRVYSAVSGQWSDNTLDLYISFTWTQTKWIPASFTWHLNQNGAPDVSWAAALNSVSAGYNTWMCQSGLNISFGGSTALLPNDHDDGVNVQGWMNCCWDPGTIAITNWTYSTIDGHIIEADISYNSQHWTWATDGSSTRMDIENIAAHEEGHSIGLGDEYGAADNLDTMYGWSGNGEITKRTLHVDDVEGSEYLYPHGGRPDITSSIPTGWYAPIVPRPVADGSFGSVPLPASLVGNTTCYVSWNIRNAGSDCASPHYHSHFYRDDSWIWIDSIGSLHDAGVDAPRVNVSVDVAGGRHTLEMRYDAEEDIVESNEGNNIYRIQYVWSPMTLVDQQSLYANAPPATGYFATPNCDGYQVTGNWWSSVAVVPLFSEDDYDLRLFSDYANAITGFSTPLVESAAGGQVTDFVLVNGNAAGSGLTRQAGVIRYTAGSGGNYLLHTSNQVGATLYPGTGYAAEVATGTLPIGASEILKVHEVYLGSTATTYRFTMNCLSGSPDLDIAIYDAHTSYLAKADFLAGSFGGAAGGSEFFTYQPPTTGYYGVVVFKKNCATVGVGGSYELRVGRALANLSAGTAPSGWASPVVPRDTYDATGSYAPLPASLPGNSTGTYLNYATEQQGPGATPGWTGRVYLDDELFVSGDMSPDPCDPALWYLANSGPVAIRGGRHSLTHIADYGGTVAESNEADNTWSGQWIWSPLPTTRATPNVRPAPPPSGTSAISNCDGAVFTRTGGFAWVTAMAPYNLGDDYDLYVYDDYAGPASGFSNLRSFSTWGNRSTDFVVGNYLGTPTTIYPAVVRYATLGGGGSFALDQTDAVGRNSGETGSFLGQELGASRLADVYEANLTLGQSYRFILTRTAGTADLELEIFPGTAGGIFSRGQGTDGVPVLPYQEAVDFTVTAPDVSGWHPIIVFRTSGENAALPVTYNLVWGTPATDAESEPAPPSAFAFRGAFPNPTSGQITFSFSLPSRTQVSLEIYDLRGRRVARLESDELPPGIHQLAWNGCGTNGAGVSSGAYYACLRAQGWMRTQLVNVVH